MHSARIRRRRLAPFAALLTGLAAAQTARASDLSALLTDLYGGDGIVLDTTTFNGTSHAPHFSADSLAQLNRLSGDLSGALGLFAFNSTAASFTFDLELGVPVRSTDSLGPILAERATTIGEGRLSVGYSYNRVEYKQFNGRALDSLHLFFTHEDVNGDGVLGPNPNANPPQLSDVETDLVQVDLDVELAQDVHTLYANYGVSRNFDLGIAIPIVSVDLSARAHASVVRNATNPPSTSVHNFASPPTGLEDLPDSAVRGSASGIGDLLLRGKVQVRRSEGSWPALAVVGQVVAPTGDEDDLLGTGGWRGMGMLVADRTFDQASAHLNVGYEIAEGHGRDNLRYLAGVDVRLHPRVTAVADIVGRWQPSGAAASRSLVDSAFGAKIDVFRSVVVATNFIVPLNRSHGLRPNFIWALGLEYTFGGAE